MVSLSDIIGSKHPQHFLLANCKKTKLLAKSDLKKTGHEKKTKKPARVKRMPDKSFPPARKLHSCCRLRQKTGCSSQK
jgi:hypothetical protein